ncbi:MAG: hypothetical protein N4A62_00740 [Marinisporobacter sp.]|jgi:hypothetical protein|nr:hypothetical protein [Marinisporobacter sp.]
MNRLLKKGLVVFILCILTTSISLAAQNFEVIKAYLKDTNISVNNESETLKTIYYKGILYIPAPLLSEKLNCSVLCDGENNTLLLKNNRVFKDFPQSNPYKGENFVYGEIVKMDKKSKILTIEQHFDDNSISIEPNIHVSENLVIIMQRNNKKMNLDFNDLKVGDLIGAVLNKENIARGIILSE